jgi:glycosyltransferase involved in cell wall biosynthesis
MSLSVVIPCHNNCSTLVWLLRAIRASGIANVEVVCVDDASDEDVAAVAYEHHATYARLPEGAPGRRSMARNLGHRLATGAITLYLDGDVIPEPRLIPSVLRLHARSPRIVVKYPVYSIPEKPVSPPLDTLAPLILAGDHRRLGQYVTKHCGIDTRPLPRRLRDRQTDIWVLCASHCTSVERDEVEKAGGWDEKFLGWGEEDLELAYRLHRAGVTFVYPHRKHGAGYHVDHPSDWNARLAALDRNLRYFRAKFPESWLGRRSLLAAFLQENGFPAVPAMAEDAAVPDERRG